MTPEAELSGDALFAAVARGRDRQFAAVMVMMLGLAAKTHPDEIRAAMAEIFDLSIWEQQARTVASRYGEILQSQEKWLSRMSEIERQLAELGAKVEKIREWATQVTARLKDQPKPAPPIGSAPSTQVKGTR